MTCHLQECTLEVTPPGTSAMTVVFPREQLHSAQAIKTDKEGNYLSLDTDKYEPPERKKKKKKYKNSSKPSWNSKGPDSQGRYKTYRINFLKERPENETRKNALEFADFSKVEKYIMNTENDMYALHFRHFGLSQSRMRIKSGVNKVESYVRKRRQKLVVREAANLPWQGILCLVFGLVGVLLTLLIGQFYEEEPRRQGGPGARRSQQKSSYRSSNRGRPMPSRPKKTGQYHKNY